jgi:outer membrane protein assembly factor BamB
MISAAAPQRYGALTALVTGFQSTIRSRNGGQEMDTNKQPQKRPWIIAGLLILTLLSTAMTGCDRSTVSDSGSGSTSGIVNGTFVDVDGLLVAPTKAATSYPTEELNLGNDSCAGMPQFLDGMTYTFTYHSNGNDEDVWTTAWDQATGKKLWSVRTNARTWTDTPLYSSGNHLFYVSSVLTFDTKLNANTASVSIVCLDKATGATIWKNDMFTASPFFFEANSEIAMHISKQNGLADRLYVVGELVAAVPLPDPGATTVPDMTPKTSNPGIYVLDAVNGTFLWRIAWPTLSNLYSTTVPLLCDGTTLYTNISESTQAEYPAEKSSLEAFDLTTNKVLWQQGIDGEGANFVKQGNMLIFVRSAMYSDVWIDVWQINAHGATRLWTRQAEGAPEEGPRTSLAVDSSRIYLQGSKGIFRALDLASGKEVWKHQFAPTKGPITDGPDVGKLHDTYPSMTLTTTRNVLYVQDGGGLVAVFDPATGKELWNKRLSNIVWGQTATSGWFVLQVVDKGFLVIASNGKVDLWQ